MKQHREIFGLSILSIAVFACRAPAADPPSLELVQTIVLKGKAGKLDHLALDAKRDRLFLANTTNGTLDVIDLKAGKLLKQVTGQPGIQGVAYAADLDRIFVGLGSGGLCNVFDGGELSRRDQTRAQYFLLRNRRHLHLHVVTTTCSYY